MARQLGRVAWHGDDFACCCRWLLTDAVVKTPDKTDWTRPDDLKTQEEYQEIGQDLEISRPQMNITEKIGPDRTWTFEDPRRIEEYQRRLDQTGPGDLKTPEEYQMRTRRLDCSRRKNQTFVGRGGPAT
ncbi:hypothetical protein Bbelb_017160 [Branchiostoma belcheri]|nr:hypothetical protein Bbelb_017160 [Branchiostoma belcheri]